MQVSFVFWFLCSFLVFVSAFLVKSINNFSVFYIFFVFFVVLSNELYFDCEFVSSFISFSHSLSKFMDTFIAYDEYDDILVNIGMN